MITLQCRICDEEMSSMYFEENDIIECPDCWGDWE